MARRRVTRRMCLEQFEPRELLAIDFPSDIVVGRTLSVYSSSDVQNGQMKLTYAVYNQREIPISDVQLAVKLTTGVSYVQGSLPPTPNGQDLTWNLGVIPSYGRMNVEIVVALASGSILQIDEGARVRGSVDAGIVNDTAPAARLRNTPIVAAELASTLDAVTNDPVIMEKAAELDYDPAKIFAFLNEDIGYEAYEGSLRGARGTLWTEAGNSLDETSLGVALFRASGIPARYASGTLSTANTQSLILSMFPKETYLVGYLSTGVVGADPARDPELIALTRDHSWLQIDLGSGFQNADTSGLPGSAIGIAHTTPMSTFHEVADSSRHKVTMTFDAEVFSETKAAFNAGNGVTTTRVLDRTWNAVELVGKPVTVAHFVVDNNQGGLAFSSRTISYTPYLLVGDVADIAGLNEQLFTGTPYQENLTNFPLGSQFLTGLTLNMDLTSPDGTIEHHERALVDRIGYANRKNGMTSNIPVDATAPSIIGPFDAMTIHASAAMLPARYADQLAEKIRTVQAYFNSLDPNLPLSNEDQLKFRTQLVDLTRLMTYRYFHESDALVNRAAEVGAVRSYFDKPRLILGSAVITPTTPTSQGSLKLSLDLRRDSARVLLFPGQSPQAEYEFRAYQGFAATGLERSIVASMVARTSEANILNSQSVFEAAERQNIPIVVLFPDFLPTLSNRIKGSPDALARISDALASNKIVLVPESPVLINGKLGTAWYETDLLTGGTIGVAEDGGHLSAIELALTTSFSILYSEIGFMYGLLAGVLAGTFGKLEAAIALAAIGSVGNPILTILTTLAGSLGTFPGVFVGALSASAISGFGFGYAVGLYLTNKDPSAEGQLYQSLPPQRKNRDKKLIAHTVSNGTSLTIVPLNTSVITNQNQRISIPYSIVSNLIGDYDVSVTAPEGWDVTLLSDSVSIQPKPGTQSGVGKVRLVVRSMSDPSLVAQSTMDVTVQPTSPGLEVALTPDPLFFVPYQGAELPSAFQAEIRNLGPADETYQLSISNVTPGWDVITSANAAFVNAGTAGAVGVYLRPKGTALPPAGSTVSFTVAATSKSDPSIVKTVTVNFTLPSVSAVSMTVKPFMVENFPGSVTSGTITIQNIGHVQEELRLKANGLTTGIVLAGMPQTLSLAPGQKAEIPVTLTIASTTAIHTSAHVHITLSNNQADAPIRKAGMFQVRVVVPGVEALSSASATAYQLGQSDLGDRLSDLSISLSNLIQTPTDAVAKSQSVAAIDAVLQIISADPLLSSLYSRDLTITRNQLAAATTLQEVQSALDSLALYLTALSDTLKELVERQFTLRLASNVVTALPGVPAHFPIILENKGTKPTTYDLSVGGLLPSGTTATFNRSTVTLQPGETLSAGPNGITLSLSFTQDFLFPASFTVNAMAQEAPSLVQRAAASVAVRNEFIQVSTVTPNPGFTDPGGIVAVSARILNVVNSTQTVLVSYQVKSTSGANLFTSPSQAVDLTIRSSLVDVALPSFNTTGLPRSDYSIVVSIADANGVPLPGVVGQANLQVGIPVSATITVSPNTLLSGPNVVTNTLRVDAQTIPNIPLTLLGQVQTIPTSTTVVIDGNLAYVAGTNGVDIVDTANAASPVVVGTFGQGLIVQGGFTVIRALSGNRLLIATQASINATDFTLLTYSLTNPVAPTLLAQSKVPKQFISDFFVVGDRVIATTTGIDYFAGNVLDQFGDVLALDLSNPAAVTVTDELFGGSTDIYNHNGGELVDNSTIYVASTTSTGGFANTQVGHGVVRVIDYSNPSNLIETRDIRIPDTVQATEVAIEGNRALVLGSTGGWKSPFNGVGDAQLTGRMTLTLLDITDRRRPFVIGTTLITESLNRPVDTADGGARLSTISLGHGRFAISRGYVENQPVLLLADITGDNIVVASIPVPSLVNEMAFVDGKLYTTSQTGLMIYEVGSIVGTPTTIRVEVPNSEEAGKLNRVRMDSFSIRPDQIIDGTGIKTLVWNRPFAFGTTTSTLTWNTELSGLQPNESRKVTNGTGIAFTSAGTPGMFNLPATSVVGQNAITITPATQTAAPGASATFDVTLRNPTDSFLSFTLSTSGIPESWMEFPRFVFVDPNSTKTETLRITAPAKTPEGSMDFKIVATANATLQGMSQGTLLLQGVPVQPDSQAHGVSVSIRALNDQTGQGNDAAYILRLTNTGSVAESFVLSSVLPFGFSGTFEKTSVTIPPGKGNYHEISLIISPPVGTPPGQYPFTVTASSTTSKATNSISSEVRVLDVGVAVQLNATSGSPGDVFQMQVTNVGTVTDTFDIQRGGPAGITSSLSIAQVTLQPNESRTVTVTTQPVDAILPGGFPLTVLARSRSAPSVVDSDTTTLNIPSTRGLTTRFEISEKTLGGPGISSFNLLVHNAGNTEDSYTATIIGTSGPITGSLIGLDGLPTQTIPVFRLPALAKGAITVNTAMPSLGQGVVRVQVRSLTDGTLVSESTATLNVINDPPRLAITSLQADRAEGNSGLNAFTYTVTRSGNENVETVVDFAVSGRGNHPINAADFGGILPSGKLTFSARETSKTITINVRGDTIPEFDEGFNVTLTNATGGGIITVPAATGTIRNDDKLTASADSYLLVQGEQANLNILANDQGSTYPFDRSALQFRDGPAHATIAVAADRTVLWTPDTAYFGPDSFSYRIADSNGLFSDWTPVSISINGRPIARDDSAYVANRRQTMVDVLANDTDPDGVIANATIQIMSTSNPALGQVDVFDRKLRFTPSATFDSSVVVQYRVVDTKGAASATATVLLGVYNQNPRNPLDVNQDTFVDPLDVLETINSLNAQGTRVIAPGKNTTPFYDVNNDGFLSPLDTLVIINYLNLQSGGPSGEGDGGLAMGYTQSISTNSLSVFHHMAEATLSGNPRVVSPSQNPAWMLFDAYHRSMGNESGGCRQPEERSDEAIATDAVFADWAETFRQRETKGLRAVARRQAFRGAAAT